MTGDTLYTEAAIEDEIRATGYRGPIHPRSLAILTDWANVHGLEWMLNQVFQDSGLLVIPSDTPDWLRAFE